MRLARSVVAPRDDGETEAEEVEEKQNEQTSINLTAARLGCFCCRSKSSYEPVSEAKRSYDPELTSHVVHFAKLTIDDFI